MEHGTNNIPESKISSGLVIVIALTILLFGALGLAYFFDDSASTRPAVTDLLEKTFQTFSIGATFALIVLAINAFKVQREIEIARASAENMIADLRKSQIQANKILSHIPSTLAIINDLINEIRPEGSIPEDLVRRRSFEMQTLQLLWERKYLSLVLSEDPQTQLDECRDIVGSMENREFADFPILLEVIGYLRALVVRDDQAEGTVMLGGTHRDATELLLRAYKILDLRSQVGNFGKV